ncbi:MAG: CopG family transcriptional regulator [Angelakisella sp.]
MSDSKLKITPKKAKGEDGYKTFSIRIKDDVVVQLEDMVMKSGRTRNELIGILLEYAIKNCEIVSG